MVKHPTLNGKGASQGVTNRSVNEAVEETSAIFPEATAPRMIPNNAGVITLDPAKT
jgi:hypothetical protein